MRSHAQMISRDCPGRDYRPDSFLNDTHAGIVEALRDVRGKLLAGDQFTLYEVGYHARGPILEIGRLAGKSTIALALGSRDGSGQPVYSVELADNHLQLAKDNLARFGLLELVRLIQGHSAVEIRLLGTSFDAVFVDGDHTYEGVCDDIRALRGLVEVGGVVLFHDYWHGENEGGTYGVARAVDELTPGNGLHFRGRFGAIALFEQGDAPWV